MGVWGVMIFFLSVMCIFEDVLLWVVRVFRNIRRYTERNLCVEKISRKNDREAGKSVCLFH